MPRHARALTAVLALAITACTPADDDAAPMDAGPPTAETVADPVLFDSDALAASIVTASARVRDGEAVLITGSPRDLRLMEDLAVQVRRQGAFPFVRLRTDRMTRRLVVDVPERFDTQTPAPYAELADVFDVRIDFDAVGDPALLADVPAARLLARAQAMAPVDDAVFERVRSVYVGNGLYPTMARALEAGLPQPDLARMFWSAVSTAPAELAAIGERVKAKLEAGSELRVTALNGTDLTLRIAGRPILISDGAISEAEAAQGGAASQAWLPGGEVYLAPVPGSASGTVVFDDFEFEGTPVEDLTLTFANGRMTAMNASAGLAAIRREYDAAPAGKDLFGAFDIGLNPGVQATPENRLRTWVAAGIVSLGIGDDSWAGGSNRVLYGLYGHIAGATVTVDGTTVVEYGRLMH